MRLVLGWIALSAAAACGQKGPLYLPDEARKVIARPAAEQTKAPPATAPQSGTASPSDESKTPDSNKAPELSQATDPDKARELSQATEPDAPK